MPTRSRRRVVGARHADGSLARLAEELRQARLGAGLSLRVVADASGVSHTYLWQLEHVRAPRVPLRTLSVVFAVLGMHLSVRPYPEGPPLRDAAHARLLARFRRELPRTLRLRTEVPLRVGGGLRAWDGKVQALGEYCMLEAETVLHDLQATERRVALKMADDAVERVILLVADTRRNRRVLREFARLVSERFPLGTRDVMRELRAGRIPARSGVVLC